MLSLFVVDWKKSVSRGIAKGGYGRKCPVKQGGQRIAVSAFQQSEARLCIDACANERAQVIMATNRADTLDPALLRPGRLDRKIEFPLPDRRQKRLVFQVGGDSAALRSNCHLPACCLPRNAVKHGSLPLLQQLPPSCQMALTGQAGRERCCAAVSLSMLLHGGLPSIRIPVPENVPL